MQFPAFQFNFKRFFVLRRHQSVVVLKLNFLQSPRKKHNKVRPYLKNIEFPFRCHFATNVILKLMLVLTFSRLIAKVLRRGNLLTLYRSYQQNFDMDA